MILGNGSVAFEFNVTSNIYYIGIFDAKNMKVLVLGHKGWIGGKICDILSRRQIDYVVTLNIRGEDEALKTFISVNEITHVYCCLGRTHGRVGDKVYATIDYLQNAETFKENMNDNLYVPLSLALFCDKIDVHFTYIGTGCIFNEGSKDFTEEDIPNFFGSNYSIVKGFTDMLMKQTKCLQLRIRMPISGENNPRNFITKITTYDRICSTVNSMSVLDELLPLSVEMMVNSETGCYNFTNPGTITHNKILEMYREIVDPHFNWLNMSLEQQNQILLSKRSNNSLDTKKIQAKYHVDSIETAVRKCLEVMKK